MTKAAAIPSRRTRLSSACRSKRTKAAKAPRRRRTTAAWRVWSENWQSVQLFLACASKWDMVGVGLGGVQYTGLNENRIDMVLRLNKVRDPRRVFDDLRVMEAEARTVMNRKLADDAKR